MFEAYEALVEPAQFPVSDEPVWILGKCYNTKTDLESLKADIKSKLWFTYRQGFSAIGGTGPTSDYGWGCMLRCGQMVLAQSLIWTHLGKDWMWQQGSTDPTYERILRMFEDKKNAVFSIHQIAQMGDSEGKQVGNWLGPNNIAQVLKKLVVYDTWSSINVYVAMECTVIINDIKESCKSRFSVPNDLPDANLGDSASATSSFISTMSNGVSQRDRVSWRPLLLFIPLRLGVCEINGVYVSSLKKCFTMKQTLGIIGGKPNNAFYFIGYMEEELVYLDPHTTQQVACLDCEDSNCRAASLETFHCNTSSRMSFYQLDPSISLCFYCKSEEEFDDLCIQIRKMLIEDERHPMFELFTDKPATWVEPDSYSDYDLSDQACGGSLDDFCIEDRRFDTSDEELEILG